MGGRLLDWLGGGDLVNLPAAASMVGPGGLLGTDNSVALYFANDVGVKKLFILDQQAVDWFEVDIPAITSLQFRTMPDVDWSTPPTDGQVFIYDLASDKMIPSNFPITFNAEDAQDALDAAFSGGTHIGLTITYDDVGNVFDFALDDAYVEGLADVRIAALAPGIADGRIAAASIADLADVYTLAGIANGQVLMWSTANSRFEFGTPSTVGSIDDLDDVDTSTDAPAVGDFLMFDGANWVPTQVMEGIWVPTEPSAADFSTLRTGSAMTPMVVTDEAVKGIRLVNVRSSTGSNWKQAYAFKTVTAQPFRAECRLSQPYQSGNDFFMVGIAIGTTNAADVARHLSIKWVFSNGSAFESAPQKHTGLNTVEVAWTTVVGPASLATQTCQMWMAIEWDGTNIKCYWSFDGGHNWIHIATESDVFFTGDPNLVGFGWEGVASDGGNHYTWCDHFYVTYDLTEPMGKNRLTPVTLTEVISGFNQETGTTYTPILSDANGIVECTNASPIVFTIPDNADVAFELYDTIEIHQGGAGAITFAEDTSVTILSRGGLLTTAGQDAVAVIRKIATDTWRLTGDLV